MQVYDQICLVPRDGTPVWVASEALSVLHGGLMREICEQHVSKLEGELEAHGGWNKSLPPIDVATPDGTRFYVRFGSHRMLAALNKGTPVKLRVTVMPLKEIFLTGALEATTALAAAPINRLHLVRKVVCLCAKAAFPELCKGKEWELTDTQLAQIRDSIKEWVRSTQAALSMCVLRTMRK